MAKETKEPTPTIEERVTALEEALVRTLFRVEKLEAIVKALTTPASPPPAQVTGSNTIGAQAAAIGPRLNVVGA